MRELKVVATPIGCLTDITERARQTLSETDAIICENKKICRKLLSALGIKGKFIMQYSADSPEKAVNVLTRAGNAEKCVFVTSAGTPLISDPGHLLVKKAGELKINVSPVPGPTALAAALSVCPYKIKDFVFTGFLPKSSGKIKRVLEKYFEIGVPVVALTTKREVRKTARILCAGFRCSGIFLAREMTKMHEEYRSFSTPAEFFEWAEGDIKGEITLVIIPEKEGRGQGFSRPVPYHKPCPLPLL